MEDSVIICRCEEITAGEIREAIKLGANTVTAVKRMVRAGMGLCQGRTCSKLVMQLLASETGQSTDTLVPDNNRPPVRPISFGQLSFEEEK